MREINDHVRQVMDITPLKKTTKTTKPTKVKKDYTRTILWTSMVLFTVAIWSLIYYLFN